MTRDKEGVACLGEPRRRINMRAESGQIRNMLLLCVYVCPYLDLRIQVYLCINTPIQWHMIFMLHMNTGNCQGTKSTNNPSS